MNIGPPPPYHITYTEEQDEYILQAQEEIRNDEHKNGFWETKGSAKTKRCAKSDDKYQRLLKCIMPPTISRVWRIRRNINALWNIPGFVLSLCIRFIKFILFLATESFYRKREKLWRGFCIIFNFYLIPINIQNKIALCCLWTTVIFILLSRANFCYNNFWGSWTNPK